ncbi:MAG: peptidase M16 [Bacteroidetes bacterium OLB11]|nr:MAG: peptidase M16 [Bacteroidetes bacterium OLB11]
MIAFEDLSLLNRANNLAFYELIGDANRMNTELSNYQKVNKDDVLQYANEVLIHSNSNTLLYLSKTDTIHE